MAAMPSSKLVVGTLIPPLLVCMIWALSVPTAMAKNFLLSPQILLWGRALDYCNYELKMQTNCDLVLYDRWKAVWSSNTHGKGKNCFLWMQEDGNLVVYNGTGTPVWASNTNYGKANYILMLQPDRNFVIYGPAIWASNTQVEGAGVTVAAPKASNETRGVTSII